MTVVDDPRQPATETPPVPRITLARRRIILAGVAASTSIALALVTLLVSPFVMILIARSDDTVDWDKLSDISQTFGVASALLSGLALAGLALSVLLQTRQLKIGQFQGMRAMQLELMRMLLEDPALAAISPKTHNISRKQWRREIYINLLFKYLEMGYAIGYVGEEGLRGHIREQLDVPSARQFWKRSRQLWDVSATSPTRRRFFNLVDGEYHAAVDRHRTPPAASRPPSRVRARKGRRIVAAIGLGFVVGAIARTASERFLSTARANHKRRI